jgi:diguanylate cyclase (GGDEF)-like protein
MCRVELDLDHFKSINDTYGHLFGDLVLARTGEIVHAQVRNTDIAGRFGGEEFVFGLSNTDLNGAGVFAERVRKAIAEEPFVTPERELVTVTCSIGISVVDATTPDAIAAIFRADKALYRAKATGRNRVCSWDADHDGMVARS